MYHMSVNRVRLDLDPIEECWIVKVKDIDVRVGALGDNEWDWTHLAQELKKNELYASSSFGQYLRNALLHHNSGSWDEENLQAEFDRLGEYLADTTATHLRYKGALRTPPAS